VAAIHAGRHAGHSLEDARHVALIRKPRLRCNDVGPRREQLDEEHPATAGLNRVPMFRERVVENDRVGFVSDREIVRTLCIRALEQEAEIGDWIQKASARADVTMSVCTGAFLVAKAGLFDGLKATTHHGAYDSFQQMYPSVTLIRGPRYVEQPNVSSSGGESSGVDLALRVVERYYGANVANAAAYNMEYRRTTRPIP